MKMACEVLGTPDRHVPAYFAPTSLQLLKASCVAMQAAAGSGGGGGGGGAELQSWRFFFSCWGEVAGAEGEGDSVN